MMWNVKLVSDQQISILCMIFLIEHEIFHRIAITPWKWEEEYKLDFSKWIQLF